ncbi:MAG: hypothetical protein ABSC93_32430 [Bryobacteraceae bacterium]|jgi:hypothetical protein
MHTDNHPKLSQQQADSNRRNAQKSTGPRTPEGKAASSRNGLTHGLSGDKHFILEGEDPEAFLRLLQDLHDHLRPVGDSEELVVKRIAAAQWRLDRAFALETGIYREESTMLTGLDRQKRKYHEFYMNRDGKDSNPADPHEPDDLLARAFMAGGKGPDNFTRLVRYETAIERSIERGMKHLRALQAARNAQCPAVPEASHAPEPPAPEQPNLPSTHLDSKNYEANPEPGAFPQSSPVPPSPVIHHEPPTTNNDDE